MFPFYVVFSSYVLFLLVQMIVPILWIQVSCLQIGSLCVNITAVFICCVHKLCFDYFLFYPVNSSSLTPSPLNPWVVQLYNLHVQLYYPFLVIFVSIKTKILVQNNLTYKCRYKQINKKKSLKLCSNFPIETP